MSLDYGPRNSKTCRQTLVAVAAAKLATSAQIARTQSVIVQLKR
jgi:hypothetical protein